MNQILTGAIKNPGCANNPGFKVQSEMTPMQFLRHTQCEQKLLQKLESMRTKNKLTTLLKNIQEALC